MITTAVFDCTQNIEIVFIIYKLIFIILMYRIYMERLDIENYLHNKFK